LHTFSSLNKNFLLQYENTMSKADLSIVYIDEKSFKQKKIAPLNALDVQEAFNDKNLYFYNQVSELETHLKGINFKNSNLLLMSSGNFSGLDLIKLARELKV
jgi:UDP-N-acetylmuramate: L-alanyl-gamma-D-glutamyl-meso-diaminopimelate ligase